MEPDRSFDVSPTAFSAPQAASTPRDLTSEAQPAHWPSPSTPTAPTRADADIGLADDDVDWDPPHVRESVVWGFRAFVAFAGLVFLMFLGQVFSGDDDGGSIRPPAGPDITTSVPVDGSPAPAPALSDDLSGDGF